MLKRPGGAPGAVALLAAADAVQAPGQVQDVIAPSVVADAASVNADSRVAVACIPAFAASPPCAVGTRAEVAERH